MTSPLDTEKCHLVLNGRQARVRDPDLIEASYLSNRNRRSLASIELNLKGPRCQEWKVVSLRCHQDLGFNPARGREDRELYMGLECNI